VAQITSGHNGFLDLVVQIGLPGLLLALCAVIVAPMRVLLTDAGLDRSRRSLLTALVVFGVGHNLTESSLFDRDAAVHVFLMLAIALLAVETRSASAPADTLAGATA
jgi:O-antigen ligase